MDLISVIIPMYNSEKFIGKLLNCIKLQTYSNLEIIVVDDGSGDKSLDIAKEFAIQDSRITVISSEHAGVGNARNKGIERANGQYITFLDSDDYIEDDMYEKLIGKIRELNVPVLRCNFVKEDINGNKLMCPNNLLDIADKELKENEIKTKLLQYIFEDKLPTYMPIILAKTELIKNKIKFNTDISFMEDLIFFLELVLSAKSIFFYDYKCYHYVINSNSSTKSRNRFLYNCYDSVKVIHILEKILKKHDVDNAIYPKINYIYLSIFIKYLARIFDKNDEYTISYNQMVEMIKETEIGNIIKKSDLSDCQNENIRIMANYIEKEQYEKVYTYAKSINL